MSRLLLTMVCSLLLSCPARLVAADPIRMEWTVDGVVREAAVFAPTKAIPESPPLVFGFHGHGGHMRNAARSFRIHELWPEAVVVYMQGLNTPGRLTDPEGKKPGWQSTLGDQNDRDLKFFDAVLATMKEKHKIDESRIYSTGHSNGGGFTYVLWRARGDVFAAVAPSAAIAARVMNDLTPKPVMHIAGENDALVKFTWQEATLVRLRSINGCGEGIPWHDQKSCTIYPSKTNTPVVTVIHPGTHKYPDEAPPLIVKFFKEHRKSEKKAPTKAKTES